MIVQEHFIRKEKFYIYYVIWCLFQIRKMSLADELLADLEEIDGGQGS